MKSVNIKHKGVPVIGVIHRKNGIIEANILSTYKDIEIEVRDEKGRLTKLYPLRRKKG